MAMRIIVKTLEKQSLQAIPDVTIIDTSANQYYLLREPVLFHLAKAAVTACSRKYSRILAIILPELPAESSLFWRPLEAAFGLPIIVLSMGGEHRVLMPDLAPDDPRLFMSMSVEFTARLSLESQAEVERRLVRRVGHFERPTSGDPVCSRYFWDGSYAVPGISRLIAGRIIEAVENGEMAEPELVAIHSPMSPWLLKVAMTVADHLDLQDNPIIDVSRGFPEGLKSSQLLQHVVLITDLVDTGNAAEEALRVLLDHGAEVEPVIFAAMSRGTTGVVECHENTYLVSHLFKVDPHSFLQVNCPMCKLGIPHDSSTEESYYQIRAYDMWEMLLGHEWREESPVPPGAVKLQSAPDLKVVFEEYGDWIALKLRERLTSLKSLGVGEDVTVVCPDEPNVLVLVDRLRTLYDHRLTVVAIPREAIGKDVQTVRRLGRVARDRRDSSVWYTQLEHLAEKRIGVVVIDEFNASGGTVRGLMKLLKDSHIHVIAYLPFWDRAPGEANGGFATTCSLYEFYSPRGSYAI